jgi:hypothetical protein
MLISRLHPRIDPPPLVRGRISWQFTLAAAAYNLIRLPKLLEAPA